MPQSHPKAFILCERCFRELIEITGAAIFITASSVQTFFYEDTMTFAGRCRGCGLPYRHKVCQTSENTPKQPEKPPTVDIYA